MIQDLEINYRNSEHLQLFYNVFLAHYNSLWLTKYHYGDCVEGSGLITGFLKQPQPYRSCFSNGEMQVKNLQLQL